MDFSITQLSKKQQKRQITSDQRRQRKNTYSEKKQEDKDNKLLDMMNSLPSNVHCPPFNIFGSPNGSDLDVMICVNDKFKELQPDENNRVCELYNIRVADKLNITVKIINSNICIIKYGLIDWVAHGVAWESNNAVFYTYSLHTQTSLCFVSTQITPSEFQKNMKLHRAIRCILSVVTRTKEYRTLVKSALHKDITLKNRMKAVLEIDFTKLTWTAEDKDKKDAHLKRGAYQTIQALQCLNGTEVYTKKELANVYPNATPFLYRQTASYDDYKNLNQLFRELIEFINTRASKGLINLEQSEIEANLMISNIL